MFSKSNQKMARGNENETNARNLIANGTEITGDIKTDGHIRIEGKLKGNLMSQGRVVVGKSGSIVGEVECKNCQIEGVIEGKITAFEELSISSSGKIHGEMNFGQLEVEKGGVFTGTSNLINKSGSQKMISPQK